MLQSEIDPSDTTGIEKLLHSSDSDLGKTKGSARTRVMAVLREETRLNAFGTNEKAKMLDLERVTDVSTLTVHYLSDAKTPGANAKVLTKEYKETTGIDTHRYTTYTTASVAVAAAAAAVGTVDSRRSTLVVYSPIMCVRVWLCV